MQTLNSNSFRINFLSLSTKNLCCSCWFLRGWFAALFSTHKLNFLYNFIFVFLFSFYEDVFLIDSLLLFNRICLESICCCYYYWFLYLSTFYISKVFFFWFLNLPIYNLFIRSDKYLISILVKCDLSCSILNHIFVLQCRNSIMLWHLTKITVLSEIFSENL